MNKFLSLALSVLTVSTLLASCAPAADQLDPAITVASSDAAEYAEWLDTRLDTIPDDVVIGIGTNEAYGVDMASFDPDGYIARAIDGEVLLFGKTAAGLDRAVREYAKAADVGATAELDTVYHEGVRIKKLTIAGRDISEYTIIFNNDREVKNPGYTSPTFGNAQYGAGELVRLLQKATGITLPMEPMTDELPGPVISIDYYTGGDLGENGFTYKVEDGNIYINGVGKANGCAYAVYYLLEHECGWDALLFGDSDLQKADHVDIAEGTTATVKPMFNYFHMREMFHDDFVTDKSSFSHKYKGSVPKASHSIPRWSREEQGNYQMCYTEENNILITIDSILYYVKNQVAAGNIIDEDIVAIDIGMADNAVFCKCNYCVKVYKEENRAFSGTYVRFANTVAEEVGSEFPGLKYTLYAYHGTNVPCKTVPRDDVYITYCLNGACANHLLDGSECFENCSDMLRTTLQWIDGKNESLDMVTNADHLEWLRGWRELTENVYVYHYILPGNFGEYTYLRTLYKDLHLMADAGAVGFSPEAEYTGMGIGRLRFQLMMDIIWHPEMTEKEYEARISDHLRREYGDGGDFVLDFIEIWQATERNTGCWECWLYDDLIAPEIFDINVYAERAVEMYGLLEKALKQCNTAAQEDRIKRLMCDVLYKECYTQYFKAYDAEDTDKIEYLEGRYDLFVEYFSECGYSFETLPDNIWAFGPYVYNALEKKILEDTLEEAAWIDWLGWRDDLTPEGTTQKPMPDKWADWYETSETETPA